MLESAFKTTTFCYKFQWNLNSYSQTLTLLFITYTIYPSNVPILLCWHQLRSLWATLQYLCDHFLQPHRVESSSKHRKEKQRKRIVIYKPHFLFFNEHPKDIWLNLLMRLVKLMWVECSSKYKKEKQWKSRKSSQLPATFYSTAKKIFWTTIEYLIKLLTTYPIYTSNLPLILKYKLLLSDSDFTLYNIYNLSF